MPPAPTYNDIQFSVLMSLYHKENPRYLDKCLESLFKQTLRATEIVLVVDGPVPQPLHDIVDKWSGQLPIKTVPLPENVGLGLALATGIRACSHELIARMDTDDICMASRFEKQIKFMAAHAGIAICGTCIQEIEPQTERPLGIRNVPLTNSEIKARLPTRNPFNHMTVMYRKSAILTVGNYEHFPFMEDWYLWAKLVKAGYACANLPDCLVHARTGADMVGRRGGLDYVKSEYRITKFFVGGRLTSFFTGWLVFFARAMPRLLPVAIRQKIYTFLRG